MKYTSLSLLIGFLFITLNIIGQESNSSDEMLGLWLTGNTKAKVDVFKCGYKYCGKIVWLKEPTYEDGTPKRDKHNPDESKHSTLIDGLQILNDFEYDDDYEWEDGTIYDAESGKTYSCVISMDEEDKNTLSVRGYVGISWLGRTDVWTRTTLE